MKCHKTEEEKKTKKLSQFLKNFSVNVNFFTELLGMCAEQKAFQTSAALLFVTY